jgi:putative transposase
VNSPHSRNLRLHRVVDRPETFFVTKCVHPKKPALDESAREIVVSALQFALESHRIYLGAFVVMPDHWHALIGLIEPWTLPEFMHAMMSFVGARTRRQLNVNGTRWQDGYYDTLVKTGKQFSYVADYIEENPVAKGLIEQREQWIASSAHRLDLITDPWPWLYD